LIDEAQRVERAPAPPPGQGDLFEAGPAPGKGPGKGPQRKE